MIKATSPSVGFFALMLLGSFALTGCSHLCPNLCQHPCRSNLDEGIPVVLCQPIDADVRAGKKATLKFEVAGTDLHYQWFEEFPELHPIPSRGAELVVDTSTLEPGSSHTYLCVVEQAEEWLKSREVTVRVMPFVLSRGQFPDAPIPAGIHSAPTPGYPNPDCGDNYSYCAVSSTDSNWYNRPANSPKAEVTFSSATVPPGTYVECYSKDHRFVRCMALDPRTQSATFDTSPCTSSAQFRFTCYYKVSPGPSVKFMGRWLP